MLCSDWLSDSALGGDWLHFSYVKNAICEADWTYRLKSTCENITRIEFYLQGLLPKTLSTGIYTININIYRPSDITRWCDFA